MCMVLKQQWQSKESQRKESLVLQKELGLGVRPRPLLLPLSKLCSLGQVISNQCASGSSRGRTESSDQLPSLLCSPWSALPPSVSKETRVSFIH